MAKHARYSLVTWPESQNYINVPDSILVNPPEDCDDPTALDQAYLVPEDITGPLDDDTAYLRLPWPESQAWDEAPDGWDRDDVLHDYESMDAWVLQPLYEEVNA